MPRASAAQIVTAVLGGVEPRPVVELYSENYDAGTGIITDVSGFGRHASTGTSPKPALSGGAIAFTGTQWMDVDLPIASPAYPLAVLTVHETTVPLGAIGVLFEFRATATKDGNAVRRLRARCGTPTGSHIQLHEPSLAPTNGANWKLHGAGGTGKSMSCFYATHEARQQSDDFGEWIEWDGNEHVTAAATEIAGFRIGSLFVDVPPNQPLVSLLSAFVVLHAPTMAELCEMQRRIAVKYNLAQPYRYIAPQPAPISVSVPAGATRYLATIGSSEWEGGVALWYAQENSSGRVVTVGEQTASKGDSVVKNSAYGGRGAAWFRDDAASPLTSGAGVLDIPAWLANVRDAGGTVRVPTHIILSVSNADTLNNLAGAALTAAISASLVKMEEIISAVDTELPTVEWIVTTGYAGNGRPTSPAGTNWVVHPTLESWLAARAQLVSTYQTYFAGRPRFSVWLQHLSNDPIDGWLPYESTVPTLSGGLHCNDWHGSKTQGLNLLKWMVEQGIL